MFTDDDLKRLKEKMDVSNISGSYVALEKTIPFLPALLARMEAAEKGLAQTKTFRHYAHNMWTLCKMLPIDTRKESHIQECWEFGKALAEWRKAAGK